MATAHIHPPEAFSLNGNVDSDPFAGNGSQNHRLPHRYSSFDTQLFSLYASNSPSQAKRALEAHLADTDRRIHDASKLGTTLLQQKKDLSERLEEVKQKQGENEVGPELRRKLAELEKDYHELGKETARAFIPKSRMSSNDSAISSPNAQIFAREAHPSPSKMNVPSRKQRNQPSSRVHDIEFATEISTSLLAQVRHLQGALIEKDEALRAMSMEKSQLELDAEGFAQMRRAMDDNEQRYKDENWNLETQIQNLVAMSKEASEREQRLHQVVNAVKAEKAAVQRDLEELAQVHGKLSEEHITIKRQNDLEVSSLKREAANSEAERNSMQKRIDDLMLQNEELAKGLHSRMRSHEQTSGRQTPTDRDDELSENPTPNYSPPPSPTKETPRHGALNAETTKATNDWLKKDIQRLKNINHREKTEKLELKRMLRDARDEIETLRKEGPAGRRISTDRRRKANSQQDMFKKPLRPDQLGFNRNSRSEIITDEEDWEDNEGVDTPSRAVSSDLRFRHASGTVPHAQEVGSGTDKANETDAFETANEREATETEAFETGVESLGGNSSDDLTETEGTAAQLIIPGQRPLPSATGRISDRFSFDSTASTSADEEDPYDLRTPVQSSQPRYKLKIGRGGRRSLRTSSGAFDSTADTLKDSPASFVSTGSGPGAGQTLFAELRDMGEGSEDGSVNGGTPGRSSFKSPESSPDVLRKPSMLRNESEHAQPEKPQMVDTGMMTEPWQAEPTSFNLAGMVGVASTVGLGNGNDLQVPVDQDRPGLAPSPPSTTIAVFGEETSSAEERVQKDLQQQGQYHSPGDPNHSVISYMHGSDDELAEMQTFLPPDEFRMQAKEVGNERRSAPSPQIVRQGGLDNSSNDRAPPTPTRLLETASQKTSPYPPDSIHDYVSKPAPLFSPAKSKSSDRGAHAQVMSDHPRSSHVQPLAFSSVVSLQIEPAAPESVEAPIQPQDTSPLRANRTSLVASPFSIRESLLVHPPLTQSDLMAPPLSRSSVPWPATEPRFHVSPLNPRNSQQMNSGNSITYDNPASSANDRLIPGLSNTKPGMGFFTAIADQSISVPPPADYSATNHSELDAFALDDSDPSAVTFTGTENELEHQQYIRPSSPADDASVQEPTLSINDDSDADKWQAFKGSSDNGVALEPWRSDYSRPAVQPLPVQLADEGTQTMVSAQEIEDLIQQKHKAAISAPLGFPSPASQSSLRSRSSQESDGSSTKAVRRGSVRKNLQDLPPLPPDHREVIAAAAQKAPAPATQARPSTPAPPGSMGPPLAPASAYRPTLRPKTPSFEQRPANAQGATSRGGTTPRALHNSTANRYETPAQLTRRSSVSSFASEIDERFNIAKAPGPLQMPADFGSQAIDPRMIQAITQTMIGEYLWKYTRRAGRGGISEKRHKRFFWVHPYTRTLYWSEQDPSTAGRAELRAKSVAIESVRVVTDDNPYPPGLCNKSLVVVTPGRIIQFTAATAQRHETWFNALSYLLLKTSGERDEVEGTGALAAPAGTNGEITADDVEEFNPQSQRGNRQSAAGRSRSRASITSWASRRTASPQKRGRGEVPSLAQRQSIAAAKRSQSSNQGSVSGRLSGLSGFLRAPSSIRGSFSTVRSRRSTQPGELAGLHDGAGAGRRSMGDERSAMHDSAEDLRAVIERQEREADRIENVRACCDGKHDVGSLARRAPGSSVNGRHNHNNTSLPHAHPTRPQPLDPASHYQDSRNEGDNGGAGSYTGL